jgi:TolB-like protein/Tfp pilus assembly protein PilF
MRTPGFAAIRAAEVGMDTAELRLLGGFSLLDREGRSVALPTRKAQALLTILARRPGEPVSRARLAGLLWPDRPDPQGRASLRQALAAVRRALAACGAGAPEARADAVALGRDGLRVDVTAFEAALAVDDLDGALACYAGPLLDGFPPVEDLFDDWAEAERRALAARVAGALRRRLEAHVASGSAEAALALADRALALDPAFELAYRIRMELLAARGDRVGALREYERCRSALRRSVGVPPSDETEAVRAALEAEAAPAPRAARRAPSVAVLPFEVLSDDPAAATFARGLAEDIGVELSRFRSLEVIARDSALRAAQDGLDPAAMGQALGAEYLLFASVRAAVGRLRVTARLVEAASGRQAWADRFDADQADVFAVEDRIAQAVVSALALGIDESELARARGRAPERLDAYACWVRGMTCLRRGTREADLEARGLFRRALELDPAYARAYVGLSLSHFNDWSCAAWERWDDNEREAFRYAQDAVRLDDHDGVVHSILGRILLYRREFEAAAAHLERALALNPNDADVLANVALGYAYLGEPERGLALGAAARRLHPFHPEWYVAVLAVGHFLARAPREAIDLLARAPDAHVDTRAFLAAAHAHLGDLDRARADLRRFLSRFASSIAPGARPDQAIGWVLRVNPLRRVEDRSYLVAGLARAGLPVEDEPGLPAPA